MPVTYQLNRGDEIIETRCTGLVTLGEVMAHFEELGSLPSLPKRLDVFLDLETMTNLPESEQLEDVARAIEHLKSKLDWGSCAILAKRDALFGMIRIFEVFTDGLFARTRVFRDRGEALHWLREARTPGSETP